MSIENSTGNPRLDKEFEALMKYIEPQYIGFTKEQEQEHKQMLATQEAEYEANKAIEEQTTIQQKHQVFISEMIAHGNRRLAYQAAYPSSSNAAARTSACRLLAMPHIAYSIQKGLLQLRQLSIQSLREQYNGRLTGIEEKRAILAQIIRGELVTEKESTNKKGESLIIKMKNDIKERIRAIMLDNKMEEEWNQAIVSPDNGVRYSE